MRIDWLKILLGFLSFNVTYATDLYTWTPPQTCTIGQLPVQINAFPGNSPNGNSPDTAFADLNDCASILPHGGIGTFINQISSPFLIQLSFQQPSFTTPAGTCTLILKMHKCTSSCYWELEPVPFSIINTPPIIQDPKNNLIYVEDGKTQIESYVPYDIEMSPLTQMRLFGTANPPWVSFSGNNLVSSPPNGTNGVFQVYVEAFDGAMVSPPFLININVTDFPYFNDNLMNQTVKVGGGPNTISYKLPSANNSRSMPATVSDVGLPYFAHLKPDGTWIHFDPPYSEGPGEYNITLQLASDGLYKIQYFFLKVINTPPYNMSNIMDAQSYLMSKSQYNLMQNKDPEGNIVICTFINISSPMVPYFVFNPLSKMFIFFPDPVIFSHHPKSVMTLNYTAFYDIFDGYFHVPLKFNISVIRPPGLNAIYLKFLTSVDDNTAPCFLFKASVPILYWPKQILYADQPKVKYRYQVWDKESNEVILTHNIKQMNASSFMQINRINYTTYQFEFAPKSKDAGIYTVDVVLTDNHKHPLSTKYAAVLEVLPNPKIKPPEKIPKSQRVKPQIIAVTRGGKVTVRFRPIFKSKQLPLELNNQTVSFYLEKWDKGLEKELQKVSPRHIDELELGKGLLIPSYLQKWGNAFNVYQLNFTGIPKNTLRKYMNNKGESIINLYVNTTLLDTEAQKLEDQKAGRILEEKIQGQWISKRELSRGYVPPQISQYEIWGKVVDAIAFVLGFAVIPANVALKGLTSVSMNFLWGSMNDMSFLTILSFISITVPGIAQTIQVVILKFLYLDILMTDEWLYPLILKEEQELLDSQIPDDDEDDIFLDKGINVYFDQNGIQSMFTVKNLGSTLVYLVVVIFFYIVLVFTSLLYGMFGILHGAYLFIKKHMVWNFTLRFLIQQFQPLVMFSIINLYHLQHDTIIYTSSTLITFFTLILTQIVILIMTVVIRKSEKANNLDKKSFNETYGVMIEGLTLSGFAGKYWYLLVLTRWTVVSVILVVLRDFSTFQIQLNIVLSWVFQVIIVTGKPLESKFENMMLMFNELMVSIYLYVLISLTDYNDDADLFDNCGIALLTIVMIAFSVNFIKFLLFTLRDLYRKLKEKYCNNQKKYQLEQSNKEELPQKNRLVKQYSFEKSPPLPFETNNLPYNLDDDFNSVANNNANDITMNQQIEVKKKNNQKFIV